jgi:predicted anti-sigma-YlaC factor YlaD
MKCELFREQLNSYVEESMDEDRRHSFRRHLRECGGCRKWALASDPSLIFAIDDEMPDDAKAVENCAGAVAAQIRQQRLSRRLRGRRRPWLAAAAAMVMVVGAGLVWTSIFGGGENQPAAVAETVVGQPATAPPTVEVDMPGEDVRVYQFADEETDNTAVYFIVNPALEL